MSERPPSPPRHEPIRPPSPPPPPVPGRYDLIARFNGGANAGHTVVVDDKKFAFHLLPCGLIYPHTRNLIGHGCVVHIPSLFSELEPLTKAGIDTTGRLFVSDRAHVLFDFHKAADGAREAAMKTGGNAIGTTKQGIGPAYMSKMARHGVRFADLKHRDTFRTRVTRMIDDYRAWFNLDIDTKAELDKWVQGGWVVRA